MAGIYGNISCPACLQILPTAVLRGFLELGILTAAKQGLMCQPLTGRSSGRRRFLKLGEVWESFAGNQFSLNYQIFLHFLVSRTVLMKVTTSLANQNPFIGGIEGEPCPTFGTMKLTLKNCPGLMEKFVSLHNSLRGKIRCFSSQAQMRAAQDHNPKCLFILVGTKEDLLSEETCAPFLERGLDLNISKPRVWGKVAAICNQPKTALLICKVGEPCKISRQVCKVYAYI